MDISVQLSPQGSSQSSLSSDQSDITDAERTPSRPPQKKAKSIFGIKALLEEHGVAGATILEEIAEGTLTRKNRLKFVRILVSCIIENFGDRPKSDVKVRMAKAIVDEFPCLKDEEGQGFEAWYTPGKGNHSATGWIEERLRNVRRTSSLGSASASSSTVTNSKILTTATLPASEVSSEELDSMKEWLKHNVDPVSQVSTFMERTAIKRAEWIRLNPGQPFDNILREYPRLFDTPGMVELDFRALYSDISDNLYMQWTPTYTTEVLKYASLQAKWQNYLHINASTLNDASAEKKTNISIGLLPCILPTGRKGKKRASIDEALAMFIDIKPIGTNMPKYLEEVKNEQPYILIQGTLSTPNQCFVIVERKALEQASLLKAVDVCFKIFYILDLNYPWQCSTTWEYFQKAIYGLEDVHRHSSTSPAVIAMRTALKVATKS